VANVGKFEVLDAERIVSLFDSLGIGVYIVTPDKVVLYVNNYFVKLTEVSKQRLIGIDFKEVHTYERSIIDAVLDCEETVSFFQDVTIFERSYRQLITAIPIFDSKGAIQYIIAMIESIDDHSARIEQATREEIINSVTYSSSGDGDDNMVKIIAESPQMKDILQAVNIIAPSRSSILIEGESGTGKEVIAQLIHLKSNRSKEKLVAINCATLPESLLEAELFGYEKGAFTGASEKGKKGLIEEADGGTLFLDEINSMPISMQGKMLRVFETKTVRRLGANKEIPVDFRMISAANVDLKEMCDKGTFREDLFYRLNVIPIELPPLRNRREDIVPLSKFFISEYGKMYDKFVSLSDTAFEQLLRYSWPGNIRELKNLIERMVVMTIPGVVHKIPSSMFSGKEVALSYPVHLDVSASNLHDEFLNSNISLSEYLDSKEADILRAYSHKFSTMSEMADALKIDRTSVGRKLKKYNIKIDRKMD
jgi:transcriptional regulator with PAS, ATPase and Fis domain